MLGQDRKTCQPVLKFNGYINEYDKCENFEQQVAASLI